MRKLLLTVAAIVFGWSSGAAATTTLSVPGTGSIWLANQPTGTSLFGDVVGENSPVAVPLGALGNPGSLYFQVTGATARDPFPPLFDADGTGEENASIGTVFGLSGAIAPYSSLVGVFLDLDTSHPTPAFSDFGSLGSRSFVSLSPSLQQVFFVGDGLTGAGSGTRQRFIVPAGADELYLATFDTGSFNNSGILQVTLIPEPSTALLLGLGLAGMAARRRV
jgi:hypothetical protein